MAERINLDVVDDQLGMKVGELAAGVTRGVEHFTFTYNRDFAAHPHGYDLEPDLPRTSLAPVFSSRSHGTSRSSDRGR